MNEASGAVRDRCWLLVLAMRSDLTVRKGGFFFYRILTLKTRRCMDRFHMHIGGVRHKRG